MLPWKTGAHLLLLLHLRRSCWGGADLQHPLIKVCRDIHVVFYARKVLLMLSQE
jgi:hypothetical protein